MEFPGDLRYTKEHEWVRVDGEAAVVGITEFAQSELGEIVFVELPDSGVKFEQGSSLCVVESTKAASDVYCPVGGIVQEGNPALADKPELVNDSPYDEGWLVRFSSIDSADLENLMTHEEYTAYVTEQK